MKRDVPLSVIERIRTNRGLCRQLEKYGFGERPMREADFRKICHDEDILLLRRKMIVGGYHARLKADGRCFIVIRQKLSKKEFVQVAFHEIGHHFLHTRSIPKSILRNPKELKRWTERQENEANAFMYIALNVN